MGTIDAIGALSSNKFSDFEILIFNDFSIGRTGKLAEDIKKKEGRKVTHNPVTWAWLQLLEGVRRARWTI